MLSGARGKKKREVRQGGRKRMAKQEVLLWRKGGEDQKGPDGGQELF